MTDSSTHKDFLYHLSQGHYQAAIDLGKELDIDTDLVYKAQWSARLDELGAHLTKQDIDTLERIHDDAWVVSQCLHTILDQYNLQQRLLQLGLAKTQPHTSSLLKQQPKPSSVSNTDKLWIAARRYLLQYLDRLDTFNKVWPQKANDGIIFPEAYGQFRDINLVAQAIEFARTENNRALDALFMHHGQSILPQRLFILSQVPETVDPASFDLPHVSGDREANWVQEPWRPEPDPVEQPWVDDILSQHQPDSSDDGNNDSDNEKTKQGNDKEGILALAPEEEHFLSQLNQVVQTTPYPASADIITQWYVQRAAMTDALGLASHALGLVRFAKVVGVPGMDDYVERYDWLCKFIYASSSPTTTDVMTLDTFEQLSAYDVLEGLLCHTTVETVVQDMKRLVLPWLERYTRKRQLQERKGDDDDDDDDDERPIFLLYRWLLDLASEHLGKCCVVFEQSKPTLPIEDRIIRDDYDLSRLVLAVVYSGDGSMEYLVRMFECLPITLENIEQESEEGEDAAVDMASLLPLAGTPLGLFTALQSIGKSGLLKMMDTLQSHLMSAEVLARYHASVPLRWYLEDQSAEVQRQLCIRVASQAAGGVESGGAQFDRDDDWRELLDDMQRLHRQDGVFGKMDEKEIMHIFYSTLLRCGQFQLAKELVLGSKPLLTFEQAETLVIDAEKEFFDNSQTGNMNTGNMKKAWDCLHVLPPTANIKKEMDLIEATHTLISVYQVTDKPGVVLMPIQLRQSTNRLDLISKLVNTRKGIYRQYKEIVSLASKLGYQGDVLAEVTVLAMMAGAAMVDEEYVTCYRLCQATIDKAQSVISSKQYKQEYVNKIHQAAWQICFNLGKLDAWDDTLRRLDALAMALTVCPVEYTHDILTVYQDLEQRQPGRLLDHPLDIMALESTRYDDMDIQRGAAGWQGLLSSAKKRQWMLGDLLKTGQDQLITPGTTPFSDRKSPLPSSSSTSSFSSSAVGESGDADRDIMQGGKRKRDQLREIVGGVGGWLFQQ